MEPEAIDFKSIDGVAVGTLWIVGDQTHIQYVSKGEFDTRNCTLLGKSKFSDKWMVIVIKNDKRTILPESEAVGILYGQKVL